MSTWDDLETALTRVVGDLENDTKLFINLLQSYAAQLEAIGKMGGRRSKYYSKCMKFGMSIEK